MNGYNNFNSQYDSMNNNANNSPMQPVKNRFFNQDLLNNADINGVGSSVSGQANNWGTNNADNMRSPNALEHIFNQEPNDIMNVEQPVAQEEQKRNQFAGIFSQDLLENVNTTVYNNSQPEILDDMNVNNQGNFANNTYVNQQNNDSTLFGYTENEVLDNEPISNSYDNIDVLDSVDVLNNVGASAPIFNQNVGNVDPHSQMSISQDLMSQQPLSMNTLGATPINENAIPDVVEERRYFQNNNVNLNNNDIQPNQQQPMNYTNGVAALLEDNVVVIDETALMKAYIGPNYAKYFKSNFSAFAFLLGSLAFFCRSMYFTGVLFFAFQAVVLFLFIDVPYIVLAVYVVLAFIMALIINPLYLFLVKGKVRKIRKKHPKISQGDLNNLCAKVGSNNLFIAFMLQLVLVLGVVVFAVKIVKIDFKAMFNDFYKQVEKNTNNEQDIKFLGTLTYNNVSIEDYFSIIVPEGYEKNKDMNFSYVYQTAGEGEYNTCSFKFGGVSKFKDSNELLKKMVKYYDVSESNTDSVNFGELEWHLLKVELEEGKKYYWSTDIDGRLLMFEFTSGTNTPSGICDSHIVNILNSIERK